MDPINLQWRGGVNLLVDNRALRDDQLQSAKDCWPLLDGQLAKREPVLCERIAISDFATYRVITTHIPEPVTGFDFVIHYIDGAGDEYLAAGNFDNQTIASMARVKLGDDGDGIAFPNIQARNYRPVSFANYRGRVVAVVEGMEGIYQLIMSPNMVGYRWVRANFDWSSPSFISPSPQTQVTSVMPRVCCNYRGRMHYFNFGPGKGNWMVAADRVWPAPSGVAENPFRFPVITSVGSDVLADNGRHFEFDRLQGEDIISAEEISQGTQDQPLKSALLVKTAKHAVIYTGELSETTDTGTTFSSYLGDFTGGKVNYKCGIAGEKATCRAPNGTFWANDDDVYVLYDEYPRPIRLGTNIRPALKASPKNLRMFWHMVYADGAIHLSIPTANSADEQNMVVQHWRLDLRPRGAGDEVAAPKGPAEASWWGPMDYEAIGRLGGSVTGFLSPSIVEVDDVLFGWYWGDVDMNDNQKLMLVTFNQGASGRDIPYPEVVTGRDWAALEDVPLNDVVKPSILARNGMLYVATTAGATGAGEPVWPGVGGAVVDGTVVWTELTATVVGRPPSFEATDAPVIQMAPDFKSITLGDQMVDKLFTRADVSAYFGVRQEAWLELVGNQGNWKQFAGPITIGDFTLGKFPAGNDLGLLQLDLSSLAKEFQVRQFRPNARARLTGNIPTSGLEDTTVIRARDIQPKFRDGSGFVIDDSNDYIIWCGYDITGIRGALYQAQVEHGYYANVDAVLSAIVDAMNSVAAVGYGGVDISPNPWSFDSAFAAPHPYMSSLRLAFDARDTIDDRVGFLCQLDPFETTAQDGITYYVNRCARLLATLGFDTGALSTLTIGGIDMNLVSEQATPLLASPTRICATQSIPYFNSTVVAISQLTMDLKVKRGRPMPIRPRQS